MKSRLYHYEQPYLDYSKISTNTFDTVATPMNELVNWLNDQLKLKEVSKARVELDAMHEPLKLEDNADVTVVGQKHVSDSETDSNEGDIEEDDEGGEEEPGLDEEHE
jgi:hypothetical protein